MKLLFIICESSVEARIIEIITHAGAPGFTKFTNAVGSGKNGLREGTPIWPGLNSIIMTGVPDELVEGIVAGIDKLEEERGGRLAAKLFAVPAQEYT